MQTNNVQMETEALRRMGGGRCRREAIDLASLRAARMAKFNQWHTRDGGLTAPSRKGIQWPSDAPLPQSMALHNQVVGRCIRYVEPVKPNPAAQRRIERLEAWKARQGVHAAFNGKMTAGYWVGEARKIISRLIRDRKSGLYHAVNDARWQRYMQYARIALHGFVWSFHYHGRFVGYITAMNLEAATRCAEDQALQFSPTAPIEQIRSGIQLKVGY